LIDRKVIDGHVIPHHVIFTTPARLEHPYETIAFEDNLKVTATFFTQIDGKTPKGEINAHC
jgi:fasciclin 1